MPRPLPTSSTPSAVSAPSISSTIPSISRRRPTLLVFTLGPAAEERRRRLLPARAGEAERRLHGFCLEAAIAAGREAGCRVVVSAPTALAVPEGVERLVQRGRGFGDRLERAVRELSGDGPLVVVGSDVPDLTPEHVRRALARLERDLESLVVGPATDGGFYLVAASEVGKLASLLPAVRWCRRDTLRSLETACHRASRPVARLERLGDLDDRRDLDRWLAAGAAPAVRGLAALVDLLRRTVVALCRSGDLSAACPVLVPVRRRPPGRAPPSHRSLR